MATSVVYRGFLHVGGSLGGRPIRSRAAGLPDSSGWGGGLRPLVRAPRVSVLGRRPESTPVAWPPGRLDTDGSGVLGRSPGHPLLVAPSGSGLPGKRTLVGATAGPGFSPALR